MSFFPSEHKDYDKGHGRIETRKIRCSTALNDYIKFPYLAQVFRIERITTDIDGGNRRHEIAYGITSLTTEKATPEKVLSLVRGHWSIENSLHWVRDVTFDEDRSQVRKGSGPRVMASLRNLAIGLFRKCGSSNIAESLRHCSWNPSRSLELLGI